MSIPFTQFVLPDGRRRRVFIDRPEHIEEAAEAIMAQGYRFEIEVLTTGHVSMTVTDDDGDLCVEVVPNDHRVSPAVDRLVEQARAMLLSGGP